MGYPMVRQDNNGVAIIKKYPNRRLYNTETSCYITLEDLFEKIRLGEDFEVRDAKTDEDLTRQVLTQIIFEQEAKGYNLLPISFLRRLISLYGNAQVSPMVPNYLDLTMENFMQNQEKLRQYANVGSWQDFTPMKMFESLTQQNMEMFESAMKFFNPTDEKKK